MSYLDVVKREKEDARIKQLVEIEDAKFLSEDDMRRLNRISIATMNGELSLSERDRFSRWVDDKAHYLRRMLNNMYRNMGDASYEAPDLSTMLYKMEQFFDFAKDNPVYDGYNARLTIAIAKTLINDYQMIYDIRESTTRQYCG